MPSLNCSTNLLLGCNLCSLATAGGRSQVIPSKFNIGAKIAFVSDAPEKEDDDAGEPFQSQWALTIFDPMLTYLGLKREEVFMGYAAKCRPPEGQVILPETADFCRRTWLMKELPSTQVRILVLFGLSFAKRFHKALEYNEPFWTDMWIRHQGMVLLYPMLHPRQYLARPDANRELFKDQIRKLKQSIDDIIRSSEVPF